MRAYSDSVGVQLVSANIEVQGKPWFRPYVVQSRKVWGREVRIGVTGVTAGMHGVGRGWPDSLQPVVGDPYQAATRLLDQLAAESDVQILLAFLPAAELDRIASELGGYEILVGSTGDLRDPPPVGPVPAVLAPGSKCKYLAWVALRPDPAGGLAVSGAAIEPLDEPVPDDPRMAERVRVFKSRLGDGLPPVVTAPQPSGSSPDGSPAARP